jgi:hypothetical protein
MVAPPQAIDLVLQPRAPLQAKWRLLQASYCQRQARHLDSLHAAPMGASTACEGWGSSAAAGGPSGHEAMSAPPGGACETRGRAAGIQIFRAFRVDA